MDSAPEEILNSPGCSEGVFNAPLQPAVVAAVTGKFQLAGEHGAMAPQGSIFPVELTLLC